MSFLRQRPGLKFFLIGVVALMIVVLGSKALGGDFTSSPSAEGTPSIPTTSSAPAVTKTADSQTGVSTASITAVEFAKQYYNLSYKDTEQSRKTLLAPYTTEKFLEGLKLGFDPKNLVADKDFIDQQKQQRATIGSPVPGEIESGIKLPVDLITTSNSSKSSTLSFIATVYLNKVGNDWKVVALDDSN